MIRWDLSEQDENASFYPFLPTNSNVGQGVGHGGGGGTKGVFSYWWFVSSSILTKKFDDENYALKQK